MAELAIQKLEHIEQLLIGIDTKIDNFLGFEELKESELKELRGIRNEMQKGDYATFALRSAITAMS
jgi:hypothetical protein